MLSEASITSVPFVASKNTIDETYYWIGKRKMTAAKSMGAKMTQVLEKNQDTTEMTGLDAFL